MFVVQELKLLMAHASDIQIIEMNVSLGWIGVVRLLHPFCRVAESERDTIKDALSAVFKGNFSSKPKGIDVTCARNCATKAGAGCETVLCSWMQESERGQAAFLNSLTCGF